MNQFDMSWKDFQPEKSRIGRIIHRLFLRFSIAWLKFDIAIYHKSENRKHLAWLKTELGEFERQLAILDIQEN